MRDRQYAQVDAESVPVTPKRNSLMREADCEGAHGSVSRCGEDTPEVERSMPYTPPSAAPRQDQSVVETPSAVIVQPPNADRDRPPVQLLFGGIPVTTTSASEETIELPHTPARWQITVSDERKVLRDEDVPSGSVMSDAGGGEADLNSSILFHAMGDPQYLHEQQRQRQRRRQQDSARPRFTVQSSTGSFSAEEVAELAPAEAFWTQEMVLTKLHNAFATTLPETLKRIGWLTAKTVGFAVVLGVFNVLITVLKVYTVHAWWAAFPFQQGDPTVVPAKFGISSMTDFTITSIMSCMFGPMYMMFFYGATLTRGLWFLVVIPMFMLVGAFHFCVFFLWNPMWNGLIFAVNYIFQLYPYLACAWWMNRKLGVDYLYRAFALPLIGLVVANGVYASFLLPLVWHLPSDGVKVVIRLVVHPIFWEVASMLARVCAAQYGNENPMHTIFVQIWVDYAASVYGRLVLVGITDNQLQIGLLFAVVAVELLMRWTEEKREYLFVRLFYNVKGAYQHCHSTRSLFRRGLALHAEEVLELMAIIWTPFTVWLYNIPENGYYNPPGVLFGDMGIAMAIEIVLTAVLFYLDERIGVPVVKAVQVAEGHRRFWILWLVQVFWSSWAWHSMVMIYACTLKNCISGMTYLL